MEIVRERGGMGHDLTHGDGRIGKIRVAQCAGQVRRSVRVQPDPAVFNQPHHAQRGNHFCYRCNFEIRVLRHGEIFGAVCAPINERVDDLTARDDRDRRAHGIVPGEHVVDDLLALLVRIRVGAGAFSRALRGQGNGRQRGQNKCKQAFLLHAGIVTYFCKVVTGRGTPRERWGGERQGDAVPGKIAEIDAPERCGIFAQG